MDKSFSSSASPGTTLSRTTSLFGLFEDERPPSKRATRDAVVRLTRLGTPDLEEIANRGGHAEEVFLSQQSSTAASDALEGLLGPDRLSRSGGGKHSRHARSHHSPSGSMRGNGPSMLNSMTRPLSGVSRPVSNQESNSLGGGSGDDGDDLAGSIDEEILRQRPSTPPTPLLTPPWSPISSTHSQTLLGSTQRLGTTGAGGGGSMARASASTGLASEFASFHTGSADTLPSKARALLDRHSFYSAGVRSFDNQRPRDFTVMPGERREVRQSPGSTRVFRVRSVLPSRAPGDEEVEVVEGSKDRTGEEERLLKVKQCIKMVLMSTGPSKGRAMLERSFRLADKDGSGELTFDEVNFCLRNDFAIKGLTPGDMRRLFASMDADDSGFVAHDEFVQAIDETPLPEFKHKVGYRVAPTPQNLKVRVSFQVWPLRFDLGTFLFCGKDAPLVELTVRNVGYAECRFRVHVKHLDSSLGQQATVLEQPRGLVAPGLRGKVVVEFKSRDKGSLTCLICLETADQIAEVPVVGYCSDGQDEGAQQQHTTALPPVRSSGGQDGSSGSGKGVKGQGGADGGAQGERSKGGAGDTSGIKTVEGQDGWFGETKSDLATSLSAVTFA